MNCKYTPEEQFYLTLELKKVYENHYKMPTLFIYPVEFFTFDGVFFADSLRRFIIKKDSICDTWKVKLSDQSEFIDFKNTSLYDSVVQLFQE